MKNKSTILVLITLVLFELCLVFLYAILPELVPMKYSLSGTVSSTMPKLQALLLFGGFQAIYALYLGWKYETSQAVRPKYSLGYYLLMGLFLFTLIFPLVN